MKKLTLGILFLAGLLSNSFAQSSSLKGTVIDTSEKKNLSNAVVSLLRKSDSVLVKFTRTDKDGKFSMTTLPKGAFFVLVTHPNYADYFDNADLDGSSEISMKTVPMITKAQLLEEVVVRQQLGAIRMKKDTMEFMADSFKVAPNANVEELLRRLPGFEIDKDGKIKAQGEAVQKVLVDGEEFFGNDPTVATQNIRADNVQSVQVFDKKSDQATFSGIDDGQRMKTVNLKLKEDKKNGFFGKVTVGGGLKDKFANQGMINAFKGKRKLAAFGTMANTGQTGLNWSDQENYAGSPELIEMEEGSGMYTYGDEFGGGSFYGEGLPTGWSGGIHYSNKYNDGKNTLNGSYRYNKLNTVGGGITTGQYILPDTLYYRNERGYNRNSRIRNAGNGLYEATIDSFTTIKITANGSLSKNETFNSNLAESFSEDLKKVNESNRYTTSTGDQQSFTSTALLRRRFRKAGRTMSLNLNQVYKNGESDGFLVSENKYYDEFEQLRTSDSINQQKRNVSKVMTLAGKVVFTEALSKTSFLEANYAISNSQSHSERVTLGNINGKYEDYVDSLSTDYEFDVLSHRGGLSYRLNKKKFNFSVGSDVSNSNFRQRDLIQDTTLTYTFVNLFPRANFNYIMGPQRRFSWSYNGSTRQPTIEQLQPLRDNTDPLNVYRGNPDLKQSFTNNFRMSFFDYKVLTSRSMNFSVNLNTVSNAIGNSETFDYDLGKRIYQPVNLNGNYNASFYGGYHLKIKKSDFNVGLNANAFTTRNNSIVNGQMNRTDNSNFGIGPSINYYKPKKMNFGLYSSVNRNISKSSIRKEIETKYWSTSLYPRFTIFLPKKLEFGTDASIDIRQKTALFDRNLNVIKWNAYAAKKFFKDESLVLRFEIKDILDQNIGFQRNISSNNITERTYDTLRRFWLLSLTYNFSKNGAAPKSMWD